MSAADRLKNARGLGGYGFSFVVSLMISGVVELLAGCVAGHCPDVGSHGHGEPRPPRPRSGCGEGWFVGGVHGEPGLAAGGGF